MLQYNITGLNADWSDSFEHDILWWYHVNNIEPWEGTWVNSRWHESGPGVM